MLQCCYNNLHPARGKRLILIGSEGTPYLLEHSKKQGSGKKKVSDLEAASINTEGTVL